jgi:hypothetical protein
MCCFCQKCFTGATAVAILTIVLLLHTPYSPNLLHDALSRLFLIKIRHAMGTFTTPLMTRTHIQIPSFVSPPNSSTTIWILYQPGTKKQSSETSLLQNDLRFRQCNSATGSSLPTRHFLRQEACTSTN